MKQLTITGDPGPNAPLAEQVKWLRQAVQQLALASRQEGSRIADPYTVTAPGIWTESRTLNPSTATDAQVSAVVGTLIRDMQKRGMNRRPGG